MRQQIDPWMAIAFAANPKHIDDHFDRMDFLQEVQLHDMVTIADVYPEFVTYCAECEASANAYPEDDNRG